MIYHNVKRLTKYSKKIFCQFNININFLNILSKTELKPVFDCL